MPAKKPPRSGGFDELPRAETLLDALEACAKSAALVEGSQTRSALKARAELKAARLTLRRHMQRLIMQARAGRADRVHAASELARAATESEHAATVLKEFYLVKMQRDRCRMDLHAASLGLEALSTRRGAARKTISGEGFLAGERSVRWRRLHTSQ